MRRLVTVLTGLIVFTAACASDGTTTSDTEAPDDSSVASAPGTEPATTEAATSGSEPTGSEATGSEATDPPTSETPATEPEVTEPPPTEAPPSELPQIGLGDYQVGVSTITITDTVRNRPLTVEVWFPLADDVTGEPHRYTFVTGDYYESPQAVSADPASISPDGPFPLVVYSHGSGGTRYIHSNYTETIASHGYLVVAPDHTGNTAVETVLDTADERSVIALNRPQDVRVVIDEMLNPESTETLGFVASADPERVAVTGHSFGGFTTYAASSGYANELGEVGPESRLDAIIPLAPAVGGDDPATQLLSDGRLVAVQTPALVIVGTNDQTTPIEPNVRRAWELTASSPHYRLELVDAQHNTFTDLCAYLDFFPTLPDVSEAVLETIESQGAEGCAPGDMAIDRAQELTNTFAISFLDSIFKGGEMIEPDAYELPDDINFQAK